MFACKKNCQKDFNKDLINRFANTYERCNKDINRFILLFRKGIYSYEYKDSWQRFDETSLPDKEAFYNSLNMEGITSVDYRHAKIVYREFKFKNLGDYCDFMFKVIHCCFQMYLKTLQTSVLKSMNFTLPIFCLHLD